MMDLPRVTDILKEAGLIDTAWFTEDGRERGRAVHLACQYLDEGTLDPATVDSQLEGYLRAYDQWKQDSHFVPQWMECPMVHPTSLYRGTPDRILVTRPRAVWDIKTGTRQAWVALQLAAYVNMLPDPYSYDRRALYLSADVKYMVQEFPKSTYVNDLSVFLSAMNILNWKRGQNNGKRSETT